MKKILKFVVIPLLIISSTGGLAYWFFFSGSAPSAGVQLIPRTAPMVFVANIGDIIDNASMDALADMDIYLINDIMKKKEDAIKDLKKEDMDFFAEMLENYYDIGIDIKKDIFIYNDDIPENHRQGSLVFFSGEVDDAERLKKIVGDFGEFLEENSNRDYVEYSEEDDYEIAFISINRSVFALAWDQEKFLLMSNPDYGIGTKKQVNKKIEKLFNLEIEDRLTANNSFNNFYYDNRTEICTWVALGKMTEFYMEEEVSDYAKKEDEMLKKIDRLMKGVAEEDIEECGGYMFFDLGKGEVSMKAGIDIGQEINEKIKEEIYLDMSKMSFEFNVKFDNSGDNALSVILKSVLQMADDVNVKNWEELGRFLNGNFNKYYDRYDYYPESDNRRDYYYE